MKEKKEKKEKTLIFKTDKEAERFVDTADLVTKKDLQVELAPLKWMIGFALTFHVAIFVKLFMS